MTLDAIQMSVRVRNPGRGPSRPGATWLAAALALALGCQTGAAPGRPVADQGVAPQASGLGTPANHESSDVEPGGLRQWTLRNGLVVEEMVTANADPESPLPMIVAIHGLGDDPVHFAEIMAQLDVPARVLLPRGLDAHNEGWSWFPIRARDNDVEGLAAGIAHAAEVIWAGIRELQTLRPTKGRPIVTGFSQGGMLSTAIAVRHGDGIAAAYPVGGWLPPPLWPASQDGAPKPAGPPIVEFHGDADKAVIYGPTKEAIEHLQAVGLDATLLTYPGVGHQITPEIHAELMQRIKETIATQSADSPPVDPKSITP